MGSKLVRSNSAGIARADLTRDCAASGASPLSIKPATKLVKWVTIVESGGAVTGVSRGKLVAVSVPPKAIKFPSDESISPF